KVIIKKVEPNSETDKNGIAPEDEITKVNGKAIKGKISDLLKDCKKEATLTIKKKFSEKTISLAVGDHYKLLELIKKESATDAQFTLRKAWCNN
ncbi:MAG: PDZ domain-containing protein, partial [Bacteroidota bacterium]|nr:PDZ domain-containing protein [Bacteroidota bacterium]